ncbi:tripartite tricarboxylate transporter permease [Thalassospira alkalitolerans]|uniref:tripartite tricarboxylate transporter permease n=1 Tax=Thalassospira alkalitolerans TaxID=1293890 RepID=UPI003AA8C7CC
MNTLLETLPYLLDFSIVISALIGVTCGILGGAMPGISPSITMALLLPFTYAMAPTDAIVMLAATYVGAEYGGSVPAILIRTPGTNAAAATVLDGYEMNLQGKAGLALGISLYSGFLGSLFGLTLLMLLSAPLAKLALAFTPPAYFALGILGLSVIATLSGGSMIKGLIAALFGLMIATIGTDPVTGSNRFTFGSSGLLGGIEPVLVMVGLFAMSELLIQAGSRGKIEHVKSRPRIQFPGLKLAKRLIKPQSIGGVIGAFEGVMPGAGGTIASFMAYNEARRYSKRKDEFGKGSPEGIAAPETANNTVAETALVPLLSFGIPGSNSTAILLGGFLIHGLQPGPMLFQKSADVIHGLYAGIFASTIGMVIVGMIILPVCVWMVNRPRAFLNAFILVLILSGIYTIHEGLTDVTLMLIAGVIGFGMRILRFPFLPTVLGLVLGFLVESNFRRSMVLSGGEASIFFENWISVGLLSVAAIFILGSTLHRVITFFRSKPQIETSNDSKG